MTSILSHLRFLNTKSALRVANNIIQTRLGTQRLRNCQIALTLSCNHTCKFCSSSLLVDHSKTPLSLDEWITVFDSLYDLGVTHIDLTGGEPTIKSPEFLSRLINYMTRYDDIIVSIATNGKIITPLLLQIYKNAGLNTILFNLQSIDPQIHDNQVNDQGNFNQIMSLIPQAQQIGLNVGINTCLGTYNFNEVHNLAQWCEKNNILLCINLAAPTGELSNQRVRISEFKDEYYKFMKSYKTVRSDTSFNFRGSNLCPGGIEKLYITTYGDVMQCTFCQISFGNVRTQSLQEIYNKFCSHPLIIQHSICKHTFNDEFREKWIQPIINHPRPPINIKDHPYYK